MAQNYSGTTGYSGIEMKMVLAVSINCKTLQTVKREKDRCGVHNKSGYEVQSKLRRRFNWNEK